MSSASVDSVAGQVAIVGGSAHHRRIVRAVADRRVPYRHLNRARQFIAQPAIRGHAARDQQLHGVIVVERAQRLGHQRIDKGLLEARGKIRHGEGRLSLRTPASTNLTPRSGTSTPCARCTFLDRA